MTSVLTQENGGNKDLFFNTKLDPVATGLPLCLCAVAAAEKAVVASCNIVGYGEVTLMVPHAISHIQRTSHLSTQHWLIYHTTLLDVSNIILK